MTISSNPGQDVTVKLALPANVDLLFFNPGRNLRRV
jgi:hypothetical protein